jgi:hypothetical protein
MDEHHLDSVLRRRADDLVVTCSCGWTSPPLPSFALAQTAFSFHLKVAAPVLVP